jgi:hypothetical protein
MKTATSLRCIALVLAALASRPCHAQGAIDLDALATPQPASVRTVMSGAEFDAAMEAVGFDAGQRTTAGSMFDDAQARMFEAKRAADAQARGLGMFDRSARTVEERAKATRELRTRMLATVDELFSSLAAVATAEQQPALARERAKARRRVIRATMPGSLGLRVASSDAETALSKSRIDASALAAAMKAMAPFDDRLEAALVRAAEAREAYDRAAAQAREGKGDREAERKAMREANTALGQVHRDALAAAAAALTPADARDASATVARTLWPMTVDARSPQRVIGQLLSDDLPAERRTAIEGIAATWWSAWWPATLKMAEASEAGGPVANKGALDEPRRAADRAAWQALANVDEANRDFHLANAEPADDGSRDFMARARGGPSLPGREGGGLAGGEGIEAAGVMIMSQVVVSATESAPADEGAGAADALPAEGNAMTFTIEAADLQDGMLSIGGASIEVADGAVDFSSIEAEEVGMDMCGARLPAAMDDAEARAIALLLGVPGEGDTLRSLLDDYRGRVRALDEELGAGVRDMLRGTGVRWMGSGKDEEPEVPEDNLRKSAPAIDRYVERLAALDAELIASIASLGAPASGAADAALARRARTRGNAVRYPVEGMMLDGPTRFVEPWDAMPPDATDAAKAAARAAIDGWSTQATAAVEAKRTALRTCGTDLLLLSRADAARMREAMAGRKAGPGQGMVTVAAAPEETTRRMDLYGRVESARTGLVAASVAGRDAVEAAIPAELRGAYRAAWNARAAPGSQRDPKDALPAIDRARGLADLTDRQRAQLDALRNDHAARHAAACNAIAELQVGQTMRDARTADADATIESIFDSSRLLEDARFERTELNARSLRRLRSMLTSEQVKQVPALAPRRRGMPMGAMPGLSPATIQAEPAPTSP